MRIAMLFSNPFPPQEGQGRYIHCLSKKLMERGHEVFVMTRGREFRKLEFDGIEVYQIPFIRAYPFHVSIHGVFVRKFLKSLDTPIDLIHFHTPLPPAISTRIPSIVTFHSPLLAHSQVAELLNTHSALLKIFCIYASHLEKSLIRSSRLVTTVSKSTANFLQEYYRVDKKIIVLGNAVGDEFLKSHGITSKEEGECNILYVGRLDIQKGLFDLIDCMKIIVENEPKAKLTIVGKGPLLAPANNRISKLGLQNHVKLKGFVNHEKVLDEYLNASIFVLPSHYEGLPTVLLEAMACRLPVVATNVPGISDIIDDGITGMLVPSKSTNELAHAILNLLSSPDLRRKLGGGGRKLVEEKFTWDIVTKRVLEAYNTACNAH